MATIGLQDFEAAALRLAFGPLALEVGRLALHEVAGEMQVEGGRSRLHALQAASAELSGVKIQGPLPHAAPPSAWKLEPLAGANGEVRSKIIDAHLMFDADVMVPVRDGAIDFGTATVEHVGPDSRLGASRLGLYVDAPNGRSYLCQFPSAPVAGVEYERRDALPGPWESDRGKLKLQDFVQGLLAQSHAGTGMGFTEQARLLLERTSLAGELRLGDGHVAGPGLQADLAGRAQGSNVVRLQSPAVGRGLTAEIATLAVRQAMLNAQGIRLACADLTGSLTLRALVDAGQVRIELGLENVRMTGLRLEFPGR